VDFFRRQNWNIIGRTWLWFGISLIVIVGGLGSWAVKGINYGIDFTGGSLLKFQFDRSPVSSELPAVQVIAKIRSLLEDHGLAKSQIQVAGGTQLLIRTPQMEEAEAARQQQQIAEGVEKLFGQQVGTVKSIGRDMVGPVVGERLTRKAFYALVLGSIFILIYIAIRYEFRFGVAAVVALIHDVLIVWGAMALLRTELNTEFIAAVLTVIGYSVNDSVVIFDRIRENMRVRRGANFVNIVNASLLQTMSRSVNTTMTTLFALVALFFFGGPAIHAFSLALIVGITSGAYSSIFIASPLVVLWERRRASAPAGARRPAPAATGAGGKSVESEAAVGPETASAEEVMKRTETEAQEEKRAERRERRKRRTDKRSRRRF